MHSQEGKRQEIRNPSYKGGNNLKQKRKLPVFISERSVQTILHPTEKNIDYTYNWNQWSLRKQALKYVDLTSKKTLSTQTNLSHFRRENYSQVYLPKDNSTQTRKDASTTITKEGMPELYVRTRKTFFHWD
ncbi:hypothetical protein AVEN_208952-1 [Araneus ventricosus]|uniref:Cilia- and flagella-associated protein 206 n=1 Tax=Araneus ventricosus TaxID=182803 RepID=A0A4Y2HPE4_ARAVE|nr:hypothetical protein AVEN_208952-1 [Araneus ventricosus]